MLPKSPVSWQLLKTRALCPQVDYTGFCTINAQRFGQKFVGRVANPHDLLLFSKAAARKAKAETGARSCWTANSPSRGLQAAYCDDLELRNSMLCPTPGVVKALIPGNPTPEACA